MKKSLKKFISMLLAVSVIIGLVPVVSHSASAASVPYEVHEDATLFKLEGESTNGKNEGEYLWLHDGRLYVAFTARDDKVFSSGEIKIGTQTISLNIDDSSANQYPALTINGENLPSKLGGDGTYCWQIGYSSDPVQITTNDIVLQATASAGGYSLKNVNYHLNIKYGMEVTKTLDKVNGEDPANPLVVNFGDTLRWKIEVKNVGDLVIRNVTVQDVLRYSNGASMMAAATLTGLNGFELEPGETQTLHAEYTATAADAGKTIVNTAIATDTGGTHAEGSNEVPVLPLPEYTVIWKNDDDSVLETDEHVVYGSTPSYDSATPTKAATEQYTYTFAGWELVSGTLGEGNIVVSDLVYKATYTDTTNNYTVIWKDEDGTVLETDNDVPYGTYPTFDKDTPTKKSDDQYHYEFTGWTPELSPVSKDITYTAVYAPTSTRTYTVTWLAYDRIPLELDRNVPYGTLVKFDGGLVEDNYANFVSYGGATPTHPSDGYNTYKFIGWKLNFGTISKDNKIVGTVEFIADFEAIPIPRTATVEVILNGTATESEDGLSGGVHKDISEMMPGAINAIYLKRSDGTGDYITLTKKNTGIYSYSSADLTNGEYKIYTRTGDTYSQLGSQVITIDNCDDTDYAPFFSVTYLSEEGTVNLPETKYYYVGSHVDVSSNVPALSGYVFKHWSEGTKTYVPTTALEPQHLDSGIKTPHTLRAVWEDVINVDVIVNVVRNGDESFYKNDLNIYLTQKHGDNYVNVPGSHKVVENWYGENPGDDVPLTYTLSGEYTDLDKDGDYSADATLYGYKFVSASEPEYDEKTKTYTVTINLAYDPAGFELKFDVYVDAAMANRFVPTEVDAKVIKWNGSSWVPIDKHQNDTTTVYIDTSKKVEVNGKQYYKGEGVQHVLAFDSAENPVLYRIELINLDAIGSFAEAATKAPYYSVSMSSGDKIEYTSAEKGFFPGGAYEGVIDIGEGCDNGHTSSGLHGTHASLTEVNEKGEHVQHDKIAAFIFAKPYSIAFCYNDGTDNIFRAVPNRFTVPALDSYVPERAGHTFIGWYTTPNGGVKIDGGEYINAVDTGLEVGGMLNLYAHWKSDITIEGTVLADIGYPCSDKTRTVTVRLQHKRADGVYVDDNTATVSLSTITGSVVSGTYSFDNVPGDYQYRILVDVNGADVVYQNEPDSAESGNLADKTKYNAASYIAECGDDTTAIVNAYISARTFELGYKVDQSKISADFRLSKVNLALCHDHNNGVYEKFTDLGSVTAFGTDGHSEMFDVTVPQNHANGYLYNYVISTVSWQGSRVNNGVEKEHKHYLTDEAARKAFAPFAIDYIGPANYEPDDTKQENRDYEQDVILQAIVVPNSYTINYNLNNGHWTAGTVPTRQHTWSFDTPINAVPERTGYTFAGWTADDKDAYVNGIVPAAVWKDVTLTAQWTPVVYNITYDLQEGNLPEGKTNPSTYTANDSFALVNPVKTGYVFLGWTGSNGDTPETAVGITAPTTGDKHFVANWQAATDTPYTIKYFLQNLDDTGFTEAKDAEVILKGTTGTAVSVNVNDDSTDPNFKQFTGFTYDAENENKVLEGTIAANGSLVLKLYYTRNSYTVKYVNDNGTTELQSYSSVKYGSTVPGYTEATPATTTSYNTAQYTYNFDGWDLTKGTVGENNTVVGDMIYKAIYNRITKTYTIIWEDYEGTELKKAVVPYGYKPIYSPNPTRESDSQNSYTFDEWLDKENKLGVAEGEKIVVCDVTLTASYTPTPRLFTGYAKIHLNDALTNVETMAGEGTKLYFSADEVTYHVLSGDDGVYSTSDLANGNYKLYGSKDNGSNYYEVCDQILTINGGTATIEVFFYTVSYDVNGGKDGPKTPNYYHAGDAVNVASEVPILDGYIFGGWWYDSDADSTVDDGEIYQHGKSLTDAIYKRYNLKAQWIKSTDVYVNFVINHRNGSSYNNDDGRHNITFTVDSRVKDSEGDYNELVSKKVTWDGTGTVTGFSTDGSTDTVTKYTGNIPVLDNVSAEMDYTVTTAKSGYSLDGADAITTAVDGNGNIVITVKLIFDPSNFNLQFAVELDDAAKGIQPELRDELWPTAVNVKVTSWYDNPYDSDENWDWHTITQHHATYVQVPIAKTGANIGSGSASFPVWKTYMDNSGEKPYHYRIEVASFVLPDGTTVVAATDVNNEHEIYQSAQGRYSAEIVMGAEAADPNSTDSNALTGAYFNGNEQKGSIKAIVSINAHTVTLIPNGGKLGGSTNNTVLTDQFVVPNLGSYVPTSDDGYVFEGWYLDEDKDGVLDADEKVSPTSGTMLTDDITLIAKWTLTVKGNIAVAGSYGGTDILDPDRPSSVLVTLHRKAPGANFYEVYGTPKTVEIDNGEGATRKDPGIGEYRFTGLPNDGGEYYITVLARNFDETFWNEAKTTAANVYEKYDTGSYHAVFDGDNVANIHAYLKFNPKSFDLDYEVDASAIGEGFRPDKVSTLIQYDNSSADGYTWATISQQVATGGQVSEFDVNGVSAEDYDVWQYHTLGHAYNYRILLEKLTFNADKTDERNVTNFSGEPYTITYTYPAFYKSLTNDQNILLKAKLTPHMFDVEYDLVGGAWPEGTVPVSKHTWSFETTVTGEPVREGYVFLGWTADETNAYVDGKITAATAKDIKLTAQWEGIKTITVTGNSDEKTYNGYDQKAEGYTVSGLEDRYTLSGISYSVGGTNVGVYTSLFSGTPKVLDADGNDVTKFYEFNFVPGKMTITPAEITIKAEDKDKVADGEVFTGFTYTVIGLLGVDTSSVVSGTPGFSGDAVSATGAGTYTITPDISGLTALNYTIKAANGTLRILPDENGDGISDVQQKKVTFRVVNGTWGDTTTEKTVYVLLDEAGQGTLSVPEGMTPDNGYEGGSWDTTPPETVSGTDPVTYTYTYEKRNDPPAPPTPPVNPPVVPGVGSVTLTKVDSADRNTTLANVVFDLYKADGTLIGTFRTEADGTITVSDLAAGEHYWIEIHPAEGYMLDSSKHVFAVSGGATTNISIANTRSPVPSAFGKDHYAYVIGYEDGMVHPEANITRAEVATIFFRLLDDATREQNMTRENNYPDVKEGMWFNTAVSTMSAMGILTGYPDGNFHPNAKITRAEFAAIAARFDANGNTTGVSFSDIYGHWAQKEIGIAHNNGWILGYDDGTFKPNQNITRAEAMTLINRVLQRIPETKDDLLADMVIWPDNMNTGKWYYLAVQEATNSHDYSRKQSGFEYWTQLRDVRDWTELEK